MFYISRVFVCSSDKSTNNDVDDEVVATATEQNERLSEEMAMPWHT